MIEQLLSTLGVSKSSMIGGFIGSLVSFKFMPDGLSWKERLSSFACALAVAWHVPPLVIEGIPLKPSLEGPVAFLLGIFGMAFVGACINAVPGIVETIRKRIGGGV